MSVMLPGSACYIKTGELEVAGFWHGQQDGMVKGLRVFMDQPELAAGGKSSLMDGLQEVFF